MKRVLFWGTLLAALMLGAFAVAAQEAATLNVRNINGLGPVLVAQNGMTLYTFKRDRLDTTNCVEPCTNNWPPYTVSSMEMLTLGEGIPGEIGTIERPDGTLQVTYNQMPLYFWVNDQAPGDATGHNFRTNWLVATPATVYVQFDEELGYILVGGNGKTLYTFANDEPNSTSCVEPCSNNWPPLTVESANALVTSVNIPGVFTTFERPDGTLQVAYNGKALYFWVNDAARGDTTGHNFRDVWFVAKP